MLFVAIVWRGSLVGLSFEYADRKRRKEMNEIYKINGHKIIGSAEAINAVKQLMVDRANLLCELDDANQEKDVIGMLNKVHATFGDDAELVLRKGNGYIDFTVRVMRAAHGLYYPFTFRLNDGTGNTMAHAQLDGAISSIQEVINGNRN